MPAVVASITVENDELQKYFNAVEKKRGVCRIMPAGRFHITDKDRPRFDCLVCSDKMGGKQTGVGADTCTNCIREERRHG